MDTPACTAPTDLSEPRHLALVSVIVETVGASGITVKTLTIHGRRQGVLVTVEGARRDGRPWTIAQMQSLMRALGPTWVDIDPVSAREVGDGWRRWVLVGRTGDLMIELVGDREDARAGVPVLVDP